MTREVSTRDASRGAGLYGRPSKSHVTACVNSKNPHGHNRACPCGWAAEEAAAAVDGDEIPESEPRNGRWLTDAELEALCAAEDAAFERASQVTPYMRREDTDGT